MILSDEVENIIALDDIFENANDMDNFYSLSELSEIDYYRGGDKICIPVEDKMLKLPISGIFYYLIEIEENGDSIVPFLNKGFEVYNVDIIAKKRGYNPCNKEIQIYNKAVEANLNEFFVEEKQYQNNVTIQNKVKTYNTIEDYLNAIHYKNIPTAAIELNEKGRKEGFFFSLDFYIALLSHHNYDRIINFLRFCKTNCLNDLLWRNWGAKEDGSLALFDYCGYSEWRSRLNS